MNNASKVIRVYGLILVFKLDRFLVINIEQLIEDVKINRLSTPENQTVEDFFVVDARQISGRELGAN